MAADDVDAVYIPLPTRVRKLWAIRAAEAKKHVLVEKPVGATAGDVADILETCRRSHVQFMDGVMFMHSRRLGTIREILDDGQSVGQVKRIDSHFCFGAPEEFFASNIRTNSNLKPLGCLGDLGWYNIRFTLWVMSDFNMERHTRRLAVRECSNSARNAQETQMFRHFAELVIANRPDSSWGEIALRTQQVVDACLQSARAGGRMIELESPAETAAAPPAGTPCP